MKGNSTNMFKSLKRAIPVAVLVLFGTASAANAGTIIGGSSMLTGGDVNQLEIWLGEGPLQLTNIYSKASGDTSFDFHAAADGQGRTITLIEVINGAVSHVVGGYNPQSWSSTNNYNYTTSAADMTAFLFNLTDQIVYEQNYRWQTYNRGSYGPTFGGGHDLYISGNLSGGYANIGHTYGDRSQYGSSAYRNAFTGSYDSWSVGALEVFTIAADETPQVPAPGALAIFCLGLVGIGYARRRKAT